METAQVSTALQIAQTQTTQTSTPDVQSYWFTYDADNRVVVNNGALENGQILVTGGTYEDPSYANSYDAAGNIVIRTTVNSTAYSVLNGPSTINYGAGDQLSQQLVYDARNALVQTDYTVDTTIGQANQGVQTVTTYDADGHQVGSNSYLHAGYIESVYGTPDKPAGDVYLNIGGWLVSGQATAYNADGVATEQVSYQSPT